MSDSNDASEVSSQDDGDVVPDSIEPMDVSPSRHPPPPPRLRERVQKARPIHLDIDGEPGTARDLMTRELLTIGPDDPLAPLETHMETFRFRHVPVVEGDVLVGLICHSDLLHAFSSNLSKSAPEENAIIRSLPASRIMRRDLITVRPTESLVNVAKLLWESRAGCVPVTEEDGTLVGIITEGDFIRLANHLLMTHTPTWPDASVGDVQGFASASRPTESTAAVPSTPASPEVPA